MLTVLKRTALPSLLCLSAFLSWQTPSFAQKTNINTRDCETNFDDAKMYYHEGELREVENKIRPCLENQAYSKEKMVEGYRLLTESYLFRENVDDASNSFEYLLRYNPLFEVDSTDPTASYDLIHLSRTYNRKPLISIYGSVGMNYSRLQVLQTYGSDNTASAATNYNQVVIGLDGGLGFEVPVYRNFDFVMEGHFALRTYRYADTMQNMGLGVHLPATGNDPVLPAKYSDLLFKENQLYIDIPVMVRYNYHWKKKIIPYAYVGLAPNFLLRSTLTGLQRKTVESEHNPSQIQGSEKEILVITKHIVKDNEGNEDTYKSTYSTLRNMVNVSVVAGVGCKFRVERNFFFFDIRYNGMLLNSVKAENRYSHKDLLYRYAYVDNDFRMDNISLSIGFMKSFYKPRKKRQYNPIVFDKKLTKLLKKEGDNTKRTASGEIKGELRSSIKDIDKKGMLQDVKAGRLGSDAIKEIKKDIKGQ